MLFEDCVVKWEFKTQNLTRRTDPQSQSNRKPRWGLGSQHRNDLLQVVCLKPIALAFQMPV